MFKAHISKAATLHEQRPEVGYLAYLYKHEGFPIASVWSDGEKIRYVII
jgi:hypothetical protein